MNGRTDALVAIGVRSPNGRVGSTLLMQLLATAEAIAFDRAPPYEIRHLMYLLSLAAMIDPSPQTVERLADPTRLIAIRESAVCDLADLQLRATDSLWTAFSDSVHSRHPQARYYAEKTVGFRMESLDPSGIAHRTIELVRDPRDMWASIIAFDAQRGYSGFGRDVAQSEQEYLFATVATLRTTLPSFGTGADPDHTILVRYEDMVADLDAVATRLGDWLGVVLDAGAAQTARPELAGHRTTSSAAASVERWRTDLDPLYAAYITDRLGPELERLGYSTDLG